MTSTPETDGPTCDRTPPCDGKARPGPYVRFCPCPEGAAARVRFEAGVTQSYPEAQVPARLAGVTLATSAAFLAGRGTEVEGAIDAAKRFVQAYREGRAPGAGLMLTGSVGTGKSGLLAAITNEIRSIGVPVAWYTYAQLVDAVQAQYSTSQESRLINASRTPVLVLDELGDPYRARGESQETEDRRRIVMTVIANRAASLRPTLISANYASLNDMAEQFDYRVADRIREACEYHVVPGRSLRKPPRI